jgi:hypothetical protein
MCTLFPSAVRGVSMYPWRIVTLICFGALFYCFVTVIKADVSSDLQGTWQVAFPGGKTDSWRFGVPNTNGGRQFQSGATIASRCVSTWDVSPSPPHRPPLQTATALLTISTSCQGTGENSGRLMPQSSTRYGIISISDDNFVFSMPGGIISRSKIAR